MLINSYSLYGIPMGFLDRCAGQMIYWIGWDRGKFARDSDFWLSLCCYKRTDKISCSGNHDKLCALVRLIRIEKVLYSLDALAEPRGEKVFFRTLYAEPKEESTIFSWFLMPVTISSSMIDPDVLASRPKVEDADTKFRKFLQFSLVANGVQTDLEEKSRNLL